MVVRLDRTGFMALTRRSSARVLLQCFVLLSLLACLGCTEKSVRLASMSTPRSVNDVEVQRGWGLLPVPVNVERE